MDVLDSNLQNPTRTAYLNTCCIANFYGFLCGMTKKSIIYRVCCFQLCVLTQCIGLWLLYVKRTGLLYMTHSLQEYTSGQLESDIWYIAWIFTAAQSCFTFPSVERQTGIVLMTPPLSFLVHQWREKDFQALNPTTTIRQTGVDLPRQQWSLLNRFHAAQIGHCAVCRKRWCLTDLDLCSHGWDPDDVSHHDICYPLRYVDKTFDQAEWRFVQTTLCRWWCGPVAGKPLEGEPVYERERSLQFPNTPRLVVVTN